MISSVVKNSWNWNFLDFRDLGLILPEAATKGVSLKRLFLKICQHSLEKSCASLPDIWVVLVNFTKSLETHFVIFFVKCLFPLPVMQSVCCTWAYEQLLFVTVSYYSFFLLRIFLYSERIQSEYRKIRTKKTPYLDTFQVVLNTMLLTLSTEIW